ncbi:MAG TPA: RagB/SusD family nutrient uptake outer membrane protein [Bacteroidetes bacterium]|nr:RagB/SusD family nutrient uptake outer membrane protein [Bacteroidota bacterium]
MKHIKYIFLIGFFYLIGCNDFLDEEPLTDVSIDFLYNTPDGLKAGLVGLYSLNRDHFHIYPNESSRPLWEYVQHDLVIPAAGYISIIGQFGPSATSPFLYGSTITKLTWRDYYKIIDRANALIKAAENIEGMDEEERLKVIAVSKYFRAHSLFTLWRLFNNVYISTEPTTPENVFDRVSQPNTKEEIFAAIAEDLDFAIENLPWTAEPGRVTQALARHIRAKLALWQEDWQLAADLAESIINSGFYFLEPDVKRVFGHPSIPGSAHRNTSETLFTIQNEEGSAGAGPPQFINVNFMARYDDIPGLKWDKAQGGRGFGFCFPNQYLLNLYEPFDKRLEAYYQINFFYNDEENIPDSVLTDHGWVYPKLGDKAEIVTTGSNQSAYYRRLHPSLLKFFDENIPAESAVSRMNILRYRLAETHLIGAEAYMRMGNQAKATEMINPLQERAGVPPIFNLTELKLMQEHARELAFEGQRFFFLKRIGKLVDQVKLFSGDPGYKDDARANIRDHFVNLPIPQSELELLGEGYPQNEGY